jgi:uncharacterized membrane protein
MVRKLFSGTHNEAKGLHTRRNYEIQRIETFSDGVFAFAVTLLIVSLEVPHSFEELLMTMRGFFAFGISFLVLISIWTEQHRFFRLYGMDDSRTIVLNGFLLFLVLFYVYPLKFVFSLMFSNQIYGLNKSPFTITLHQVPALMAIYGLGLMTIYLLFFLMYHHAFRKSKPLGLSLKEKFECKTNIYRVTLMAGFALLSVLTALALPVELAGNAGFTYFLIGPVFVMFHSYRGKLKRKLFIGKGE